MNREQALELMHSHTASDALRKHMYAVEIAMRAMAVRYDADPDAWGLVGLLHDFDYERFPNPDHAPDREHPAEGVRMLAARGLPEDAQQAILGHAAYTGVARTTPLARALFAVDELCGFLVACALVRPSRSLADLEVSSVKKKL
ncbi:MAG TPA: HD domain-containing protein, partial [Gemmatimonadales bacterium]|nr:HD domain-containing protein [Gemmatimonadales bacterium]